MKFYATDDKEVIMELSVKWAGNPNIIVAAKSFGLKATVQVVDLQVYATPRITLKPLVPSFPCFANIFVSLMDKPQVDFGLKLLGADVMAILGLYRFVQLSEFGVHTISKDVKRREDIMHETIPNIWDELITKFQCPTVCVKPARDGCSTGVARL